MRQCAANEISFLFSMLSGIGFSNNSSHEAKAGPAMWTSHIAFVVKTCADLMGFFTLFEQGTVLTL